MLGIMLVDVKILNFLEKKTKSAKSKTSKNWV